MILEKFYSAIAKRASVKRSIAARVIAAYLDTLDEIASRSGMAAVDDMRGKLGTVVQMAREQREAEEDESE